MSTKKVLHLAVIALSLLFSTHAPASELERYQFLKTSPQEQKAVVKTPDGRLQLIGVGDSIDSAKVVEIVEGRVVLEEAGVMGAETLIVRLDGKRQRIERLRRQAEPPPVLLVPSLPGADREQR